MLAARLLTAVALLVLVCSALLLLPNRYWAVFLLPGLWIASSEWAKLAGYGKVARALFIAFMLGSACALLLGLDPIAPYPPASKAGLLILWLAAAFWLGLVPVWLASECQVRNPYALAAAGWLALIPAWFAATVLQTTPERLLVLLGVVWIADTAAYVAGRRYGRHRLAPRISPGKTWEGVIGACLAVAVYYALVWMVFGRQRPLSEPGAGIALFAVMTVMSVQGDLFESWMKRQAGVKDSGTLLPGHGGVLDRIDGLTASVPLAALWLHYFERSGIV